MELNQLLEVAKSAANAGARELTSRFRGTLKIDTKSSEADYVTDADLASETAVRQVLKRLRPHDVVTGEEYDATGDSSAESSAEYYWSIDPLDGTVNFARGLPNWAVAIGVKELATGRWVVGVVHAPALGVTYFATDGGGAFAQRGQQLQRLSGPIERPAQIVATGFSYDATDRVRQFARLAQLMPHFVDVRRLGAASLDMCAVAEGSIDAYYEAGIKEWDWAGALVVAEQAGLRVRRPEFAGDLGVAARDTSLFEAVFAQG
jgi:myo-inositol-1(or 4)-monophosphatase